MALHLNFNHAREILLGENPENFSSQDFALLLDVISSSESITQMYLALRATNGILREQLEKVSAKNRQLKKEMAILQKELVEIKQQNKITHVSRLAVPLESNRKEPLEEVVLPKEENEASAVKKEESKYEKIDSGDEADDSDSDASTIKPKNSFLAIDDTP